MTIAEAIAAAEAIARSGFAALIITIIVAVMLTRELRACRARDAACAGKLHALSVGIARLHATLRERLGEHDPIPTLDELMNERRHPGAG